MYTELSIREVREQLVVISVAADDAGECATCEAIVEEFGTREEKFNGFGSAEARDAFYAAEESIVRWNSEHGGWDKDGKYINLMEF